MSLFSWVVFCLLYSAYADDKVDIVVLLGSSADAQAAGIRLARIDHQMNNNSYRLFYKNTEVRTDRFRT